LSDPAKDRPTPAEHYVRPEGLSEPSPDSNWWRRLLTSVNRFFFQKKRGYVPPYHGNFQGATLNDPRYPGLFNQPRPGEFDGDDQAVD
jgi:hypothetical protein